MQALTRRNYGMADRGRARRNELRLSVRELAERSRFSPQRVHVLETEGCGTLAVCERWAQALEMDPRDLAFGPKVGR